MITQYITSKQKLLLAVASRTFKVLSLLIIFSVGINTNNLFAQGVPANPNDPDQAPAPTITSQPSSMTACAGTTASFSVSATAGSSISYQWKKNGVNIGGATSSTLTLNAVTSASAGSYSVVVTSSGVPVTSSTASLVVTTPALSYAETLSTCAAYYVLDAGTGYSSVTWTASAGGSSLPSNPGDPDGNNLTPSQFAAASNGWYKVVAVPASGCTLVDSVYVIVNMGPTIITSQPSSSSINGGASATFSVSATGLGTLTYQWFKNGVAISGATGTSYTVSNATGSDAANYTVDVTGTCGTVTSNAATLTVNTLTITSQPVSATQCAGTNVTFSVNATVASGSISYQWKKNGSAISGETNSSLTLTGISAGDAGSYSVDVTSGAKTLNSNTANLTVNALTVINTQPSSLSVNGNGNASFSVSASGTGTLTYQWKKNGSAIAGATSASYAISNATSADDADYSVDVTGTCGTVNSNSAHLTVNTVNITSQPVSASQCAGTDVTFSVSASVSSGSVSYQWKKNGTAISGATNSSITLTGISASDAGSYTVDVTAIAGTVTSNAANLNVKALTAINTQPIDQSIYGNANASFTVSAVGTGVLTFQWSKNGTAIAGATNPALNINNATANDDADYSVEVTGACGVVSSNNAHLTVTIVNPPAITSQPASATQCAGTNVSFSVTSTVTAGGMTYQWKKNGVNIAGATSSSLSLTNVLPSDAANYTVDITGLGGTTTSNAASLTVNAGPSIVNQPVNQFRNAGNNVLLKVVPGPGITSYTWKKNGTALSNGGKISGAASSELLISNITSAEAGDYSVSLTFGGCGNTTSSTANLAVLTSQPIGTAKCAGQNVSFSAAVSSGSANVSYQWSKDGNNIAGATSSTLSLNNVSASDIGNYTVNMTVYGSTITSTGAYLSVNALTSITAQPVSTTKFTTQGYLFSANGTGSGNLTYQWTKDGNAITGATSPSLSLSNILTGSAGSYALVVTGTCGIATSNSATLTVISSTPSNQAVCAGSNASFGATVTSPSTVSYVWKKNGTTIGGQTSASLSLSNVSAADNGAYSLEISVDGNITSVGSANLLVNAATTITAQPVGATKFATQGYLFVANGTGSGSISYQWLKDGNAITGATSPSFNISSITAGSAGNYALAVTGTCGTATSNNAALSVISSGPIANSVCAGSSTAFSTTVNSPLSIAYQWKKNGVNINGQTNSSLSLSNVSAADNAVYSVGVTIDGVNTTVGSAALLVNANTAIVSHPASQTRPAGSGVTFTVNATGTGVISYQWAKDGSPIFGETSYKLDLLNLSPSAAGSYSVTASSACGPVTSNAANLTVQVAAPNITVNPTALVRQCAGTSVTLSVTATGYGTLNYQWKKDGTNINGATNSTLSLSNISGIDAGTYTVAVSNLGGSVLSTSAVVSVKAATAISSHPVSMLRRDATSAFFAVSATGADGGSFQWKKNGTNIVGATGSVLTFASVTSSNAGDYSVDVTFGCGTVSSNSASLAVLTANPSNTSKCAGQNASFSATVAAGSDAISYQWSKNGVAISGETNSTLNISNVTVADIASYAVTVSMESSSLLSNSASLTVSTLTSQPVSLLRRAGQSASFNVSTSSAASFQWKKNGSAIAGANSATYTILSAAGANAGDYTVDVTFGCGTVTSNSASLAVLTANPTNVTKCAGENASFSVSVATGSDAVNIQWLKNNVNMSGQTASTLSLTNVGVNDIANYSANITMGLNSLLSNAATLLVNTSATISSQPVSAIRFASQSVAFSATVTGNINGLTYQWTKDGSPISNSTSILGATTSTLYLTTTTTASAGSYALQVTGNCGVITSSSAGLGIVSTYTLADQSMCAGNNATFSVSATGTGLTYQWKKNGSDISGANSASYTMTGVSSSDAANYSVAVGLAGASPVTTGFGILNVRALPSVTSQPSNVNVAVGGNANFTISANNATAFRWFRVNKTTLENPVAPVGGTVVGAFTNNFSMTSVKSAFNNYRYICKVTGACGTINSDTVRLTVGGSAKNEFASVTENLEMNLFPVPAQNVINMVTNGVAEGTYSIRILDQTGKLVMDRNTSGSEVNAGLSIEISDMSTGAYFMELKNANGEVVSMSKFIKIGN